VLVKRVLFLLNAALAIAILYNIPSLIMWTIINGHLHKRQRLNRRICCHYATCHCTSHMHTETHFATPHNYVYSQRRNRSDSVKIIKMGKSKCVEAFTIFTQLTISSRIIFSGSYTINITFVNRLSFGLPFAIFLIITSTTHTLLPLIIEWLMTN
jgi:hypothetical protein